MSDDPWNKINKPDGTTDAEIERRAIESSHFYEFYRGKNTDGSYFMSFVGEFLPPKKLPPNTQYVIVEISKFKEKKNQLKFKLINPELKKLFRKLCLELISVSDGYKKGHDQIISEKILSTYQSWLDLLKKAKSKTLDKKAQIGLFGELLFILRMMSFKIKPGDVITAWRGPFKGEQDFIINKILIEVKSQLSDKDSVVNFSSAAQLDTVSGTIFISNNKISTVSDDNTEGMSLNKIIKEVNSKIKNEPDTIIDTFEAGLLELGYQESDQYEINKFCLQKKDYYEVKKNFPCLRGSELPPEISNVSYSINLDSCSDFKVEEDKVFREMMNEG